MSDNFSEYAILLAILKTKPSRLGQPPLEAQIAPVQPRSKKPKSEAPKKKAEKELSTTN